MKKIIALVNILILLSFVSCGSTSEEAKVKQTRILNTKGIRPDVISIICQDENKNRLCEDYEVQMKVALNKSDTLKSILEKITQIEEGKYFLETYDPTIPLLLVLSDPKNVRYNEGKFALNFNGFKEEQQEKELSILETMVDNGTLYANEVVAIKQLKREEDQDKFYVMLFKNLERNLNTLGDKGIVGATAMNQNIQYMSSKLRANGIEKELPEKINSCNGNDSCVDNLLEPLFNNLLIPTENSQLSPNGGAYDLWEYIVPSSSKSINKTSYSVKDNNTSQLESTQITYEVMDEFRVTEKGDDIYDILYTKNTNSIVKSIAVPNDYYQEDLLRRADVGKVVWLFDYTNGTYSVDGYCQFSDYFSQKTLYRDHTYSNLMEFICRRNINDDGLKQKDYIKKYYQKDNGFVGSIDRDCLNNTITDDTSIGCEQEAMYYTVVEPTLPPVVVTPTPTPTSTPPPVVVTPTPTPTQVFEEIAISHYNSVDFSKSSYEEEQDGYAADWSPTEEYVAGEQSGSGLWYHNNVRDEMNHYIYIQSFGDIDLATITEVDENAWLPANSKLKSLQIDDVYVVKTHDGYAKFKVVSLDADKDGGTFVATYQYSETTSF